MLYNNSEFLFFRYFFSSSINKWLFYKKYYRTNYNYVASIDFYTKDKQKVMLVFKSRLFFNFLGAEPHLVYRSSSAFSFRNKFRPDSFVVQNNLEFLLNIRHFMFLGLKKKKADYRTLGPGIVYKDLADYIKSGFFDFYQFHVSLRVHFLVQKRVGLLKSLFRLGIYDV